MLTHKNVQIGAAFLGTATSAPVEMSKNIIATSDDQAFSGDSLSAPDASSTQFTNGVHAKATLSLVGDLPQRGDFSDLSVDTVVIPGTKATPPIVATQADKIAFLFMAPTLAIVGIIGLGFVGNWIARKAGWIGDREQLKPADSQTRG